VFELSGSMMTLLPFGSGAPPCLLPWVVLGAELIARERRLSAVAGTGLALGAATHSGHPMLALLLFAAFGVAIAAHMIASWQPKRAIAIGALACLAVAIGLAIAAPALLPLLELQGEGRLYKHILPFQANVHTWVKCSRHLLPFAAFAPLLLASVRSGLMLALPYALSPVIGVSGLVLAVAGLLRLGLGAGVLAVALLGLAMTLAPPGLSWVRQLPLLREVWPPYCWSLLALPLSLAAGRGVATIATAGERRIILVALALVLAGTSSLVLLQNSSLSVWAVVVPIRDVFLGALAESAGWARFALPLALVAAVLALLTRTPARVGRRCALVVTGLSGLELLVTLAPAAWYADTTVLASPPSAAVRFLQERLAGGQYRMLGSPTVGVPSTPSLFGLRDVCGAAALPAERYVRYLQAVSPKAVWYILQYPGRTVRHPLLDLGAVRYVVRAARPQAADRLEDDAEVRLVYRDQRVVIYENAAALPRARIVHAAVPVRDQEEAFDRLREAAGDESHAAAAGLADRIFVEPTADGEPVPVAPEASPLPGEEVRILEDGDPDRVELAASLHNPGWVVLADTFYPGWTATIDGVATPIHPANLLFRSVYVPAGRHRIVFEYRPGSFRVGVALAIVGLAVSGVLFVRDRRSRC
jgi:hypothetical protein